MRDLVQSLMCCIATNVVKNYGQQNVILSTKTSNVHVEVILTKKSYNLPFLWL